jgi:hypothetical protein
VPAYGNQASGMLTGAEAPIRKRFPGPVGHEKQLFKVRTLAWCQKSPTRRTRQFLHDFPKLPTTFGMPMWAPCGTAAFKTNGRRCRRPTWLTAPATMIKKANLCRSNYRVTAPVRASLDESRGRLGSSTVSRSGSRGGNRKTAPEWTPQSNSLNLVGRVGIEPTTSGLKVRCSTD